MGRDARGAAMTQQVYRHGKGRFVQGGVVVDHQFQPELVAAVFKQGNADQAAAMLAHEVDHFGGHVAGGSDEVALVLTVFVVHHDHELAVADVLNGAFYRMKHKRKI